MLAEDIMKPLNSGRYSTEELNRFMNYLDLMLEMGKVTLETAKITFDQIHEMASFSSRDPREEARLYPRIVCFTLKTVGEMFSPEIWDTMIWEAIMYLRKTADCYDVPPLLELFVRPHIIIMTLRKNVIRTGTKLSVSPLIKGSFLSGSIDMMLMTAIINYI